MNRQLKRNHIDMELNQKLSSKKLNENQELKLEQLPELMYKHWGDIDLSSSVNETIDIWIYLWEEY